MRESILKISPFRMTNITMLSAQQQVNEHGTLVFSGLFPSAQEGVYLSQALQENLVVTVSVVDEDGTEENIFKGVLVDFEFELVNEVKRLTCKLKSCSYLMDRVPHIRSFQSPDTQYNTILDVIKSGYAENSYIMTKGQGISIPNLILQYNETDWEFIKRMASHFNTVVIPDVKYGKILYTFGVPEAGKKHEVKTVLYSIAKNVGDLLGTRNTARLMDDTVFYVLKLREIFMLGEKVILNSWPLTVYSINTQLVGSELYHTYFLTTDDSITVPGQFNNNLIGLSLDASVTAVARDKVQVSIHRDENKENTGSRWFQYSTVYSTPDGTGWYCMPEVEDAVRLYFPCEQEEKAYVASSVHLESSAGNERVNPNFKSIMNKQKKEILFTPGSLIMTNNAGMSIELSDAEGIKIISDKAISIQSQTSVDISSVADTLRLSAPQAIVLQQGGTQMQMKEKMFLKGAQVRLD